MPGCKFGKETAKQAPRPMPSFEANAQKNE
jgi:hypothetical protein